MIVIFLFSTDPFASSNTSTIIGPLLSSIFPTLSNPEIDTIHEAMRKLAHWTEYFILAVLLARALRTEFPRHRPFRKLIFCIVLATLYAASDEWHQSFVPIRSASVVDVVIDGFGAICGALSFTLSQRAKLPRQQQPK